jgi:hypothetical protein
LERCSVEGVFCLLVGIVHDFLPAMVSVLTMRPQQFMSTLPASAASSVHITCGWASCMTSCLPW